MNSNPILLFIIWISVAYLSGSIPTGYWLGKLKGIDLTTISSGSTGATNVLRNLGKGPALLTLIIDVLKGFFPVYFASKFVPCSITVVCVGIFCLIGHSKSIFLKFKGGKSSATTLGVMFALSWQIAIISFLIWLVVVYTSKYSSLGSIVAGPFVPFWFYLFHKPLAYIVFSIFAVIYIVFIRHKENIQRLFKGTEPKIGE